MSKRLKESTQCKTGVSATGIHEQNLIRTYKTEEDTDQKSQNRKTVFYHRNQSTH